MLRKWNKDEKVLEKDNRNFIKVAVICAYKKIIDLIYHSIASQ